MKKNIVFIAPSLKCGGAEQVLLTILNNINSEKFTFSLALVKNEGSLIKKLSNSVNIIDLKSRRTRYALIKLLKLIWSKKPDVIFTTLGHLNFLVIITKFFSSSRIKYICRETNIPSHVHKNFPANYIFSFLYQTLYKYYDYIICQSEDMKYDLVNTYKVPKSKLYLINNPCNVNDIKMMMIEGNKSDYFPKNKFNLLSVGSLTHQKGFDLLLHAISKINNNQFHLTIIGHGAEKQNLQRLVKKLNISSKIDFIGFKNNPYVYMHHADLFIISSRYEGFPNVVLESMACGTATIAFDSPGDLDIIIKNGINGYLVNYLNINELAETIVKASKIKFDSKVVRDSVIDRFSIEKIIPKYENLFLT